MELKKFENLVSKSEIVGVVNNFISHVGDNGNAVKHATFIAALEEFIKQVKANKQWREIVLDELRDGETTFRGVSIKPMEAGTKYDYSVCNCSRWGELDTEIKQLSDEKKKLEEQLRMVHRGSSIANADTGEVYEPPLKRSTSTYSVTLVQ